MSQKNVGCRQGLELSMIADKAIINALKKCNPSPEEIQKIIEKPGKIYQKVERHFKKSVKKCTRHFFSKRPKLAKKTFACFQSRKNFSGVIDSSKKI